MPQFLIECRRSDALAHQVEGISCENYRVGCSCTCRSKDLALAMGEEWCLIPGTYQICVTSPTGTVYGRVHTVSKP